MHCSTDAGGMERGGDGDGESGGEWSGDLTAPSAVSCVTTEALYHWPRGKRQEAIGKR
jgi:hypothetical protein